MSHRTGFRIKEEPAATRRSGISLLEVSVALVLITTIVLGVLGGLSQATAAQRSARAELESLQLRDRVLEEARAIAFDGLSDLDGTFVEQNGHRADLTVVQLEPALIQVEVNVSSSLHPNVRNVGVLLVAALD